MRATAKIGAPATRLMLDCMPESRAGVPADVMEAIRSEAFLPPARTILVDDRKAIETGGFPGTS